MMRKLLLLFLFLPFLMSGPVFSKESPQAATPAMQSESAHGEESAQHGESWSQFLGKWVNFFALIAILYFFLKRTLKVPDRFREDYKDIQRSVESARRAKEEAEERLKELDARMAGMNVEIARIKEQASVEAEEEKKRIVDLANKEAERIAELARREIEAEVQLAKKTLREQVADLSVEQGRRIIEQEINEDDQKRLMNDYIQEFGK
jgi:F-type H+-transporting ATPase subunit b